MKDAAFWELENGIAESPRSVREAIMELRRWKSTNAPRLEALEGLLRTAQAEAAAGREAIATLASERAANALLTEQVEKLQGVLDRHNQECNDLCDGRKASGTLCNAYNSRGRSCPDCPKDNVLAA